MPVNTSMYPQAQPPQNPLAMIGSLANTANALNQNRLFQQQFNANVAAGNAFRQAVDPNTGLIDAAKAGNLLSQSPASYELPKFESQVLAQKQGQVNLDTATINQHLASLKMTGQVLGGLMGSKNADGTYAATKPQIISAITSLWQNGNFGDPNSQAARAQAVQLATQVPTDPRGITQFLQQHWLQNQSAAEQFQALYGPVHMVNNGQSQTPMEYSPLGGARQVGPAIQNQLPPTTPVFNSATKQPGYLGPTAEAAAPGAAGGEPNLGPGTYPGTQPAGAMGLASQSPAPQGAAADAAGSGGFIPSGPALGAQTAADVTATGSAKELADLRTSVQQSGTQLYQLNEALDGLEKAPTGPGTETENYYKSLFLAQAPGLAQAFGVDPKEVAGYDKAVKYLTQYASTQAGAMGAGTDAKLATALTGNASTHISNLAAKDVVKANIALTRMKQAESAAWDQSPDAGNPQNFGSWATQWNKTVDPRAFAVDLMSPNDRAKMLKDMSSADKAKFLNTVRTAIATGVVALPGAMTAPGGSPVAAALAPQAPGQAQAIPLNNPLGGGQ